MLIAVLKCMESGEGNQLKKSKRKRKNVITVRRKTRKSEDHEQNEKGGEWSYSKTLKKV